MKSKSLHSLLLLCASAGLVSAACNSDNCLRALKATSTKASSFCSTYTRTPSTATAIPTYGSFCSNSPSRVSSACSCAVTITAAPRCVPTPVINGSNYGNGNFENYPPPGQGAINIQPPWYFDERGSVNAFGQYEIEPVGPNFGGTVAAFHLTGQPPDTPPGGFLRLQQPISYCNGTTYAFSLYARQRNTARQDCRLSLFTDYEGTIVSFVPPAFTDTFQKLGPVTWKPFGDNGVVNDKGEYEDLLSIIFQCTDGTAVLEVDTVRVEPVV